MHDMVKIVSGKGAYLYDDQGREILDLVSSWWVNIHGHAHPAIATAIAEQAAKLEHVIFAGFSHDPAEKLADGLIEKLGEPFRYVFYSDNGSTAVEVALKMALQFAINTGDKQRNLLVGFEGGFHGDTWAAMSAGRTSGFFDTYTDFLHPKIEHLPYPATFPGDPDQQSKEDAALAAFDTMLEECGQQIAGLLIEPLVQGAGGMRFCSPEWLTQVVEKAQACGIKVIFDEIMTGFSRTGKMFAMEHLEIRPDIICLSKGITGGFLPLSATVTTSEIYEAFLGETFGQALSHGHSYAGNPVVCAAAVASLELFDKENTLAHVAEQEKVHHKCLSSLPGTQNHRVRGAIAACELGEGTVYASASSIGLRRKFLSHGLLLRPLANTLYMIPPACLDPSTLEQAYKTLSVALSEL
jgi:adenosylmethionine-8-amino-7-oxononanoate aminotransferase